jgi:hypothetical protein
MPGIAVRDIVHWTTRLKTASKRTIRALVEPIVPAVDLPFKTLKHEIRVNLDGFSDFDAWLQEVWISRVSRKRKLTVHLNNCLTGFERIPNYGHVLRLIDVMHGV